MKKVYITLLWMQIIVLCLTNFFKKKSNKLKNNIFVET